MNHTRLPKEDHIPDWARRDNKGTKGDRANNCVVAVRARSQQLLHHRNNLLASARLAKRLTPLRLTADFELLVGMRVIDSLSD